MRRRTLIFVVSAVLVYVAVLGALKPTPDEGALPPGSSRSTTATGSQAIKALWEAFHLPFDIWTQVPALLPMNTNRTSLTVEPLQGRYTKKDADALLNWVRNGHTALWASHTTDSVMTEVGVQVLPYPKPEKTDTVYFGGSTRVEGTWQNTSMPDPGELTGPGLQKAAKVYRDTNHHVMGAVFRLGSGQLTIWSSPALFENEDVNLGNNAAVLWGLIGDQPLYWDEYGHGVETGNSWAYVFQGWRGLSLGLLVLAVLLWLWRSLERFGTPVVIEEDAPRLGTEFMDAFSTHLQDRRSRPLTIQLVKEAVHLQLAKRFGLPGTISADRLGAVVSRSTPEMVAAYQRWRDVCHTMERGRGSMKRLAETAAALLQALHSNEIPSDTEATSTIHKGREHRA